MKQIIIDSFNRVDRKTHPKKLPKGAMRLLRNGDTRYGGFSVANGTNTYIQSYLPVPILPAEVSISNDYENTQGSVGGDDLPGSKVLRKITLPVDVVAYQTLFSVGMPLMLSGTLWDNRPVSCTPPSVKVVVYTDNAGSPGEQLTVSGPMSQYSVVESVPGSEAHKTFKISYGTVTTNIAKDTVLWVGLEFDDTTHALIYFPFNNDVGSKIYKYLDGETWTTTTDNLGIIPMFSENLPSATLSSITRDDYLFKTVKLNAPKISFTSSATTTRFIKRGVNTNTTYNYADGVANIYEVTIDLPALTPIIYPAKDGVDSAHMVGFVCGYEADLPADIIDAYLTAFTGPPVALDEGDVLYTDDTIIVGINQDGFIFATYPGAMHCVPLAFSPFAFNLGGVVGTPRDSFSVLNFSDWLVLNAPFDRFAQKPIYITLKGNYIYDAAFIYRQQSMQSYMMTSSQAPTFPKFITEQTETLVFWGSYAAESTIYYGTRGEVDSVENYTSISSGAPIVAVAPFQDSTIIFFHNEIHRFSGSPAGSFSFQKIANIGIDSRNHVVSTPHAVYFMSPKNGLMKYDGVFQIIADYETIYGSQSNTGYYIAGHYWYTTDSVRYAKDRSIDWMIYNERDNEVVFRMTGTQYPGHVFGYCIESGAVHVRDASKAYALSPIACSELGAPLIFWLATSSLTSGGYYEVYRHVSKRSVAQLITGPIRFDNSREDTLFEDLILSIDRVNEITTEATLSITVRFYGATETTSTTYTVSYGGTKQNDVKVRLNRKAQYIDVSITTDGTNTMILNEMRITATDGGR